ncbi:MAG: exodeoxyribonuclease VII small subunit [Melioribacteraceae bacterium]|nr:exodeoxyribonuclease VII small subunit [Melioribacteraceae bacterium]
MAKKKENNFENSLKRLEEITQLLESGEVSLEDSINLYEEGIILAKNCYSLLKEAEIKITELKKQLDIQIK